MRVRLIVFALVILTALTFVTAAWAPPHWFKQPTTHSEQLAAPHHWKPHHW